MPRKMPYVFGADEISDVLEKSESRKIKKLIYENVKTEVEKALWKAILSPAIFNVSDRDIRATITDMPNVYFRKKTLLTLLDTFRGQMGEEHSRTLWDAGEKVGISFSEDLIRVLRERECLPNPKDHTALLETWAVFDSSAGLGWISIDKLSDDEIVVLIENSFLTFGYSKMIHRHCSFMEGYIYGTLNELFHEFYGWIDELQTLRPPAKRLSVVSVVHLKGKMRARACPYNVVLIEDSFVETHTHQYRAIQALQSEDLGVAITETRAALETCVKRVAGMNPYRDTSFYKVTKLLKENMPHHRNLVKKTDTLYSELSRIIHGGRTTLEFGREALDFCRVFTNAVQRTYFISLKQ